MSSDRGDLLIVYHTQSGNTERLASAVEQGASKTANVKVRRARAGAVSTEDFEEAGVLVLCSPEYFGYMAGAIKDLFDRTYEPTRLKVSGKPYALVICAGNDGTGTMTAMQRIIKGYGMRQVQEPIVSRGMITDEMLEKCRELGETLAAGMDLGIF